MNQSTAQDWVDFPEQDDAKATGPVSTSATESTPPALTPIPLAAPVFALASVRSLPTERGAAASAPATTAATATSATQSESERETAVYLRKETLIPAGWQFKGELTCGEPTSLNCTVDGQIELVGDHALTVQEGATVNGTLKSRNVVICGKVDGTVDAASGSVVVHTTAAINGEVRYSQLQIQGGQHNMQLVYSPASGH